MTKSTMDGEGQQIAVSVPLFLRKLWKMVNDKEAEDIIGWNSTGDGFVIYDQLQFITKLLPKYFKHNNMASFIRQLNFYDFHKVAGIDKDEIQFSHSCFLKDLPETLVFIRRKCTSLRSKLANNAKDEELSEILSGVKELKTKHALVDTELKLLKQENATLWNEVNSLRIKHAKQTKIINKIIHFLITYMHSHQSSLSKGKVSVGRRNSQNLKTGPTLLEIDYHNDPNCVQKQAKQNSYTFTEPGHSGAITYPSDKLETFSNIQPAERTLEEMLDRVSAAIQENMKDSKHLVRAAMLDESKSLLEDPQPDALINVKPSGSIQYDMGANSLQNIKTEALKNTKGDVYNAAFKKKQGPLQNALKYKILQNPKEHLGLYLNNTQLELDSLQDMLNNLNSSDLAHFCNLIEGTEMEGSKETDNAGLAGDEPAVNSEDNLVQNDECEKRSSEEELDTLPEEPNSINDVPCLDNLDSGEYSVILSDESDAMLIPVELENEQYTMESFNIEPETLADEYFTI